MKTLLITGASGFVGHELVNQALQNNLRLIVSARESSDIEFLKELNIPIVFLSLSDPEKLVDELRDLNEDYNGIDAVIHNAGLTQSFKSESYYKINTEFTYNLITALGLAFTAPPKFVFVSSLAALGSGYSNLQPIAEDHLPKPLTHYGKSKLKAEELIIAQNKIPWIIVRPTAVYGPHEKNLLTMIKTINSGFEIYLGSIDQMLSFIHVKDLARIIIELSTSTIKQETYNLSDGEAYTVLRLNQIVKSALNRATKTFVLPLILVRTIAFFTELVGRIKGKAPILNLDKVKELEQFNWLCDNRKIKNEIDFNPEYTLEKGMKMTIKWYKENEWI